MDIKDEIILLYRDCLPQKDISKQLGVSLYTVRKTLNENGFITSTYRKRDQIIYDTTKLLLLNGAKQKDICKFFDMPNHSCADFVRQNGLQKISLKVRQQEIFEKVIHLYNEGESATEIIDKTGLGRRIVYSILQKYKEMRK